MPSRFADAQAPKGEFLAFTDNEGDHSVTYRLSDARVAEAQDYGLAVTRDNALISLIDVAVASDRFTVRPHGTLPGRPNFLGPKYNRIRAITLEGFGLAGVFEEDGPEPALAGLPAGFIRDPEYGLGLLKDIRYIIAAIEKIAEVDTLVVSRTRASGLSGGTYVLTFGDFEAVRLGLGRIHSQALTSASGDKVVLAHNSLLTAILPQRFPQAQRPYKPDTIFKTVGASVAVDRLSSADKAAAIKVVSAAKQDLALNEPAALMELQRELEVVTLETLIARMTTMIARSLSEADWQAFFLEHPFVLNLAFSLPIAVIGERVSVGGRTFSGGGEKIADFMARNGLTENIALVEIKKPATRLLGAEYRGGVYPPSPELAGAVTQVLDQRYQLALSLPLLQFASRQADRQVYAVKCLVIAGALPKDPAQLKSLELFRNGLNDVIIVTYEELLAKLRGLLEFLSPPAESDDHGEDDLPVV